mgnify:CR=1 FL=1
MIEEKKIAGLMMVLMISASLAGCAGDDEEGSHKDQEGDDEEPLHQRQSVQVMNHQSLLSLPHRVWQPEV